MLSQFVRIVSRVSVVLALLAGQSALGSALEANDPPLIRIATASKSGTFYPIGSLIAQGITGVPNCTDPDECGVQGLIAVAQTSNGSVANVKAVSEGSIDAGLAQADVIYWAYNGEGRFAGEAPLRGMRAIANLYPGSLHIVTAAASGIDSVADLRGKRVALDEPGSGTLVTAELILEAVGIGKDDIEPFYVKHNHAGPMLADGKLDAFFFVAGYPTSSVVTLSKTTKIALVPLSASIIERLTDARPYLAAGVIPAGAYDGLAVDVPTVDIGTQLIVRADLTPGFVERVTAAIWSARTRRLLYEGHPKGRQVRLDTALNGIAIPLHAGAEAVYRARGLLP